MFDTYSNLVALRLLVILKRTKMDCPEIEIDKGFGDDKGIFAFECYVPLDQHPPNCKRVGLNL